VIKTFDGADGKNSLQCAVTMLFFNHGISPYQRRLKMKKVIDIKRGRVVFSFEGLESIEFDPSRAHTANQTYAAFHGWLARLGDMAAIPREQKQADGSVKTVTVTEAMRREAIETGVKYYYSGAGEWDMKAAPKTYINPQWLALANKRGVPYEVVEAEKVAADLAELSAL
jgi:hypothetical protein